MSDPLKFEPSAADPQVVKVYKLDDYTWWAGYSLQQCIKDALDEFGDDCCQDAWEDAYELTDEQMQDERFVGDGSDAQRQCRTFATELQLRIDHGEQFPQLFACTED